MPKHVKITVEQEEQIIAALTAKPHASQVARDTGWSFSTVWRVAQRAGIELTAGRTTMGRQRLSPEQRGKVIEARGANPDAPQRRIAQKAGVSRSTVWRIERGRRGAALAAE
jgi:transcriptional regulator with XRE-family HTH domain